MRSRGRDSHRGPPAHSSSLSVLLVWNSGRTGERSLSCRPNGATGPSADLGLAGTARVVHAQLAGATIRVAVASTGISTTATEGFTDPSSRERGVAPAERAASVRIADALPRRAAVPEATAVDAGFSGAALRPAGAAVVLVGGDAAATTTTAAQSAFAIVAVVAAVARAASAPGCGDGAVLGAGRTQPDAGEGGAEGPTGEEAEGSAARGARQRFSERIKALIVHDVILP